MRAYSEGNERFGRIYTLKEFPGYAEEAVDAAWTAGLQDGLIDRDLGHGPPKVTDFLVEELRGG